MSCNVIDIGNTIVFRRFTGYGISQYGQTLFRGRIDWFAQSPVDGIVCPKCKHNEFVSAVKHVCELHAIVGKQFCEMSFTARTCNGVAKHVQPRRHQCFFGRRWTFWIRKGCRMECHPSQWTPYGRHYLSSRNHTCLLSVFINLASNLVRR